MRISQSRFVYLVFLLLFLALAYAAPADARDFSAIAGLWDVADMNLDDDLCGPRPDESQCSLLAAIQQAKAMAGPHVIRIPAGACFLTAPC